MLESVCGYRYFACTGSCMIAACRPFARCCVPTNSGIFSSGNRCSSCLVYSFQIGWHAAKLLELRSDGLHLVWNMHRGRCVSLGRPRPLHFGYGQVFQHPALDKAKASVDKAGLFKRREPLWLQGCRAPRLPAYRIVVTFACVAGRCMVERLLAYADSHEERRPLARLFLLSYCFLLRVPSEAIPVTAHSGDCSLQSVGDTLVLSLNRRKNRPQGSRLVRGCWCKRSTSTCPVHVLGPLLKQKAAGERLFPGITAGDALSGLRSMLKALNVPRADEYRTHDFRRGHAKDLQLSGTAGVASCSPS